MTIWTRVVHALSSIVRLLSLVFLHHLATPSVQMYISIPYSSLKFHRKYRDSMKRHGRTAILLNLAPTHHNRSWNPIKHSHAFTRASARDHRPTNARKYSVTIDVHKRPSHELEFEPLRIDRHVHMVICHLPRFAAVLGDPHMACRAQEPETSTPAVTVRRL